MGINADHEEGIKILCGYKTVAGEILSSFVVKDGRYLRLYHYSPCEIQYKYS